jgi:hypothetical protein
MKRIPRARGRASPMKLVFLVVDLSGINGGKKLGASNLPIPA